jgi:hypothetical protein
VAWPADAVWLVGVGIGLAILCGLPYLVSVMFGPPELERLGTFWFVRDFSQYQAAMREGARQTGWLIHDHFTAEPHQPALMYPLYVAAGKFAARLGLDPLSVFAGIEWLGRAALFGALYAFAATFLGDRRQRRLAVLLAAGTLGLIALIVPLRLLVDTPLLPSAIDVYLEMSSFGVFLSAPHLMFGLALTLLAAPLYLRARSGRPVWLIVLGLDIVLLSLIHPFNLPVLVSVLSAAAVLSRSWRAWLAAGVAAVAAAPIAIYDVYLFQTDAFWSGTYGVQNRMPAAMPWALPIDLGVVLLAAPLAWSVVRTWSLERRWLIVVWIGLGLAWMYAPVPYQRRFAFGLQPALAVLAAVGLVQLANRTLGRVARRVGTYALIAGALSTSVLVYVSLIASAARNTPAEVYLWTRAESAAASWLGEHTTSTDVVLASTEFANPLVGSIDGRVVHGHIVATLRSDEKQALVQRFYAADSDALERSAVLAESHASIVALGPHERALGLTDLSGQPDLELIYDQDGVRLFRVKA